MGHTACTEPHCLYKGALYFIWPEKVKYILLSYACMLVLRDCNGKKTVVFIMMWTFLTACVFAICSSFIMYIVVISHTQHTLCNHLYAWQLVSTSSIGHQASYVIYVWRDDDLLKVETSF